jgi:LCP family protein required for cell wall assembly
VVGMDAGPGRTGGPYSDTVMVVHLPKSGDAAAVISIPRDTYLEGAAGIGKTKINAVYAKALAAEQRKAPGAGHQELVQKAQADVVATVQDLTGVRIDHYAQVDMPGFVELADVVGGVPVCLNNAVDELYSNAKFPAGVQQLKGKDALAFVRQRHGLPNGDLDRVVRQQVFVSGLVDASVKSGALADPAKRDRLLKAVRKYVVLDQRWDLVSFATQVQALTTANVRTGTIPVRDEQVGQMLVLAVNQDEVQQFVKEFTTARPAAAGGGTQTRAQQPNRVAPGSPRCVN